MPGIRVEDLDELYCDSSLYSSPDMFSPPAERLAHVIRFELTRGCSWGRCTFCDGYDGVKHHIKSDEEYRSHALQIWESIGENSPLANRLTRVFIGGGNALSLDDRELCGRLYDTRHMFEKYTGHCPKRISLCGRTGDILKSDLASLHENGLGLVYWGIESGSDDVLKYVNKGCTCEQMLQAGDMLHGSGVVASVMIMPGLGGIKYSQQHAEDTAAMLNKIEPRYVTFLGVNAGDDSPYAKRMREEIEKGENRPLTKKETAQQMVEMIRRLKPAWTKLGCFDKATDGVGDNPVTFGSYDFYDYDYPRKLWLLLRLALKVRSIK